MSKASSIGYTSDETKREIAKLDRFLETYEVATDGDWFNKGTSWYRAIVCPWESEHENRNQGASTCVIYSEGSGYGFDCKHRCAGKGWKECRMEMEARFREKFSFVKPDDTGEVLIGEAVLPLIAHATLAEAFLRDNHDFACVYDLEKRPTAQWVKTRWDFSGDDTLLWRAVSDYLKGLYDQYKETEKGPDTRKRFYDAGFITGVVRCVKPYLPSIKAEGLTKTRTCQACRIAASLI